MTNILLPVLFHSSSISLNTWKTISLFLKGPWHSDPETELQTLTCFYLLYQAHAVFFESPPSFFPFFLPSLPPTLPLYLHPFFSSTGFCWKTCAKSYARFWNTVENKTNRKSALWVYSHEGLWEIANKNNTPLTSLLHHTHRRHGSVEG